MVMSLLDFIFAAHFSSSHFEHISSMSEWYSDFCTICAVLNSYFLNVHRLLLRLVIELAAVEMPFMMNLPFGLFFEPTGRPGVY